MLGDGAFNVINTAFFILLLLVIYFHAFGTFKNFSALRFLTITALLFLLCPAFGQSFLWITGASNYMYSLLIILFFLIPYKIDSAREVPAKGTFLSGLFAVIYLPISIIAGWTSENISVAAVALSILFALYYFLKFKKVRAYFITGTLGTVIGLALLVLSPGINTRLDEAGGTGSVVDLFKRIIFYTCDAFEHLNFILVLFIIALGVLFFAYRNELKGKPLSFMSVKKMLMNQEPCEALIYLLGFLACVYSMVVSPQFPDRAWATPVVLFIISLIKVISSLAEKSKDAKAAGNEESNKINLGVLRYLTLAASSFIVVCCAAIYVDSFYEIKNVNVEFNRRVEAISAALQNGEGSVVLDDICAGTGNGYSCYGIHGDLNEDSQQWPNADIAAYYEIDEVIKS